MANEEVKARTTGDNAAEASIEYNFGDNLEDAIDKFGEESVFTCFKKDARVGVQAVMRRCMAAGKSEDEIQSICSSWKPGQTTAVARDPLQAALAEIMQKSPEEQAAFLSKIREQISSAEDEGE